MRYDLLNRAQEILGSLEFEGSLVKRAQGSSPDLMGFLDNCIGYRHGVPQIAIVNEGCLIVWNHHNEIYQLIAEDYHWVASDEAARLCEEGSAWARLQ